MPQLVTTRNFADNQVLFKVHLDTFLDDIEDWANNVKLDFENIQTGGIIAGNLAANSVITDKINTASVTLSKLAAEVSQRLNPAGSILAYGGTAAPAGYLICDGSIVSRTVQSALFAAIGTAFGNGDGSTTFHLPDLRGVFLRGRDAGRGIDVDAASRTASGAGGNTGDTVGSFQASAFLQHVHTHVHGGLFAYQGIAAGAGAGSTGVNLTNPINTNSDATNADAGGGNETRPVSVNVNYIIKT